MQAVYQEFEPDCVVNFAAESHNDRAIVDSSAFMRSNALGAQVPLECGRRYPVRTHLHVSTIEVYGELPAEFLPIYDVSARHEVTNLAIAEFILERLGKDPQEWIEHVADRPNHDRRYLIEPAKLERELGWRPTVDFAAGLAETVDWYVANEAWWQDILRSKGELQIAWAGVQ